MIRRNQKELYISKAGKLYAIYFRTNNSISSVREITILKTDNIIKYEIFRHPCFTHVFKMTLKIIDAEGNVKEYCIEAGKQQINIIFDQLCIMGMIEVK